MTRLDRQTRLFAYALAFVAGYVDAIGFLMTAGFFVSFMSGNSTQLGIDLLSKSAEAQTGGALVACFLVGVIAGGTFRMLCPRRPETAVLALVAILLAIAAALQTNRSRPADALILAAAMGAENLVFAEAGEIRVSLTYMTGTLVKLGKAVVAAFTGGPSVGWVPHLMLWLGLVMGAATGGVVHGLLGAVALWMAAGVMTIFAVFSLFIFGRHQT